MDERAPCPAIPWPGTGPSSFNGAISALWKAEEDAGAEMTGGRFNLSSRGAAPGRSDRRPYMPTNDSAVENALRTVPVSRKTICIWGATAGAGRLWC
jgi:hypothetical protein